MGSLSVSIFVLFRDRRVFNAGARMRSDLGQGKYFLPGSGMWWVLCTHASLLGLQLWQIVWMVPVNRKCVGEKVGC